MTPVLSDAMVASLVGNPATMAELPTLRASVARAKAAQKPASGGCGGCQRKRQASVQVLEYGNLKRVIARLPATELARVKRALHVDAIRIVTRNPRTGAKQETTV